jgi:hypothetical protein
MDGISLADWRAEVESKRAVQQQWIQVCFNFCTLMVLVFFNGLMVFGSMN